MHIFGIILFILTIILFYKRDIVTVYKYSLIFLFTIYFFFNIGNFFSIGGVEIVYFEFYLYVVFLLSIFFYLTKCFSMKNNLILLSFAALIVINNLLLLKNPTDIGSVVYPFTWFEFLVEGIPMSFGFSKYTLIYDIYFMMIPITFIAVKNTLSKKDFLEILNKVFIIGFITVILSFGEFFIKVLIDENILFVFRNYIFGATNFTVNESIIRNGIPVVMGFMREPSTFAYSVFIVELIAIAIFSKKKSFSVILIGTVAGFLSGSLSFIVLFMISIILFIFKYYLDFIKKHKKIFYIGSMVIIVCATVILPNAEFFNYYLQRFVNIFKVINSNAVEYGSEFERITSSVINMKVFLSRPIFGAGLGTTYSFSTIASLLASVGSIGFLVLSYSFFNSFLGETQRTLLQALLLVFATVIFSIFGSGINSLVYGELLFFGIYIRTISKEK